MRGLGGGEIGGVEARREKPIRPLAAVLDLDPYRLDVLRRHVDAVDGVGLLARRHGDRDGQALLGLGLGAGLEGHIVDGSRRKAGGASRRDQNGRHPQPVRRSQRACRSLDAEANLRAHGPTWSARRILAWKRGAGNAAADRVLSLPCASRTHRVAPTARRVWCRMPGRPRNGALSFPSRCPRGAAAESVEI